MRETSDNNRAVAIISDSFAIIGESLSCAAFVTLYFNVWLKLPLLPQMHQPHPMIKIFRILVKMHISGIIPERSQGRSRRASSASSVRYENSHVVRTGGKGRMRRFAGYVNICTLNCSAMVT
jgi:hypothetical protein